MGIILDIDSRSRRDAVPGAGANTFLLRSFIIGSASRDRGVHERRYDAEEQATAC
jgi:hypothetical protein